MVKIVTQDSVSSILNDKIGIDNSNWDYPTHLSCSHFRMNKLMPVSYLEPGNHPIDLPYAESGSVLSDLTFKDPLTERTLSFDTFLNRRLYNDALVVVHKNRIIHESYRNGMQAEDQHICHSMTKSLTAMLIGIAIEEGVMHPDDSICQYIKELKDVEFWQPVTLRHVLDMSVGSQYSEDYEDPEATFFSYARSVGYYPALEDEPVLGARGWLASGILKREQPPGHAFGYCSPLTNALMIAAEEAYQQSSLSLLEEKIFHKIGARSEGWFNTDGFNNPIAEGQLSLTMQDFVRWAGLMISGGKNFAGEQVIPAAFIRDTITPNIDSQAAFSRSEYHSYFPGAQYRNQFWVLNPQKSQYSMLGIHGQSAWFDQERELMICSFASYPVQVDPLGIKCMQALWDGIATAVEAQT